MSLRNRRNVLQYLQNLYPRMPERANEVIGYTGRLNRQLIRNIPQKKRTWWMNTLMTSRWIDVRDAMAIEIIRYERIDFEQFGRMYRSDQKKPGATLTVMLKNPIFALDLKQQIEKILEEQGMTTDYLVGKLKTIIEKAEDNGDLTNMRHAVMDTLKVAGVIGTAKPLSKANRAIEQEQNRNQIGTQDTLKMLEQANLDSLDEDEDVEDAEIVGYDPINDEELDDDEEI